MTPIGFILGFGFILSAPIIAPMFAGFGLVGAAAYSSGLATIGGGSLLAGGAGMAGGTTVLTAIGALIASIF